MSRVFQSKILLSFAACLFVAATALANPGGAGGGSQVLVTVDGTGISALQLERAIRSSPIATAFNTLDEDVQAGIRGDMLKDLIYAEMLYREGLAQGVDQRPELREEVEEYRRGLLYQRYLLELQQTLDQSDTADAAVAERLKGEPDALAAARAVSRAGRFNELKKQRLLELGNKDHLRVFKAPLAAGERRADAVVARGEQLHIVLGDLLYAGEAVDDVNADELLRRLDKRVEQGLMVLAAQAEGIDVNVRVENYARDLVRQTVMQERERAWVPDRATLETYYREHPRLSLVPEQWHVAQLVTATREEAESLRQRVVSGESLYQLAADHSIDAYGREHAGDMGWVRPDQAPAALREALAQLPAGTLSPVIQTNMGFHLAIVEARKPAKRKPLQEVAAGIRRSLIRERLAEDYQELSQRYPIQWHLPEHRSGSD